MRGEGRIELERGYVISTCTITVMRIIIRGCPQQKYEVNDGGEEPLLSLWKSSSMCNGSCLVVGSSFQLSSTVIGQAGL